MNETPSRPAAGMPRLAAVLALVLIGVVWLGIYMRRNLPNMEAFLGQGIGPTGATFITPLALFACIGLWLRKSWGWWFSLVAIAALFMSFVLFLMVTLATGDLTGVLTWTTALVQLALLVVLLLPGTRDACLVKPVQR